MKEQQHPRSLEFFNIPLQLMLVGQPYKLSHAHGYLFDFQCFEWKALTITETTYIYFKLKIIILFAKKIRPNDSRLWLMQQFYRNEQII